MRRTAFALALSLLGATAAVANGAQYHYVDWTTADPAMGTASGVINIQGEAPIQVNFAATFANGTHGSFFFAQTNGGTNYWNPTTPYISAQVENPPPDPDILALIGGENQIYTVTLSRPIADPIMSIVSLGQPSVPTTYDFDSPFTIVSQGPGFFGGGPNALVQLPGDILQGSEGHGTIQFIGTFSTFSWVVPTPEQWHGFTFGVRGSAQTAPVPLPDAAWMGLATMGGIGVLPLIRRRFGSAGVR